MTTEKTVARRKLPLLELAQELENVSRAFKEGIPKPEPKGEKRTPPKATTATAA